MKKTAAQRQQDYRARHVHDPAWQDERRAKANARHAAKRVRGWSPNPATVNAAQQAYRERHPDRCVAKSRRWREANRDKSREASRRYAAEHPEKGKRNVSRYRAMLAKAGGSFTDREWLDRLLEFGGHCAFCLQQMAAPTVEHMQSLSKGGSNDIENIIPACHGCNSKKRDRGMLWMASRIAA